MALFEDPRRIVTGHNSEGKSIVVADGPVRCETIKDGAGFAVLYETYEFPVSNDRWDDPIKNRTKNLANSQGVVLRVVDIPAGAVSVSERTSRVAKRWVADICFLPDVPQDGVAGFWYPA